MISDAQRQKLNEELTRAWDPRRHHWGWDEGGQGLWLRPGPVREQVQKYLDREGIAAEIKILDKESSHCVSASWTSIRRKPAHEAEQIAQLRVNQVFKVWAADESGLWRLGAGVDGYPGWVRAWHLAAKSRIPIPERVVTARGSRALTAPDPGAEILMDLSFATSLNIQGPPREDFFPSLLPDGRESWVPSADLAPFPSARQDAAKRVLTWAQRLLGIPYEWGGASSTGFDCSGLVQALYFAAGLILPRDADLQCEDGHKRAMKERQYWRPGDLLFFGEERVDHVALLLDEERVLHASGCVKVDALDSDASLKGRNLLAIVDPLATESFV